MKKKLLILIIALLPCFMSAYAQNPTPNAGFENWDDTTVDNSQFLVPRDWKNLNPFTDFLGVLTCLQTTNSHSGNYAAELVTDSISGEPPTPGIITTGNIDIQTQTLTGGIPFNSRPDSMYGWYIYYPVKNDSAVIQFGLYDDKGDTVGLASFVVGNTVSTYNRFSVPITYYSGNEPDTSRWFISSSGGTNSHVGSKLYIDDLSVFTCPPPNKPGIISGENLVCPNSSYTYSVSPVTGAINYIWELPIGWAISSTNDTSVTVMTGTSSGNISVSAYNNCGGPSPAQTLSISIQSAPPTPSNITGEATICPEASQIYSIAKVTGATSYTWTLPSGWSGSSNDTFITVIPGANSGNVSVTANNCAGSSSLQSLYVIIRVPQSVSLCYTTVDTESTHNIIIWNSAGFNFVDSVKIYFYNSSNQWQLLFELPYGASDYYIDTASINNPNANTVRYCLTVVDSCGNEEALSSSKWQNTLFIVNNGSGTFSWSGTGYLIEGNNSPVATYVLYRDDLGNGSWIAIDSVSGTQNQMTDPNYSNYPNGKWHVAARVTTTGDCPIIVRSAGTTTSISNKSSSATGINQLNISTSIEVYPNPIKDDFNIVFHNPMDGVLTISDILGQQIYNGIIKQSQNDIRINISGLPQGVYLLRIQGNGQTLVKKIVKL